MERRRRRADLDDLWWIPVGPLVSGFVDKIDEFALGVPFRPRNKTHIVMQEVQASRIPWITYILAAK